MKPGEHIVVVGGPEIGVAGREAGLHVRDSILVFLPGPRVMVAWLFRAPLEGTVVETVLGAGTGGVNVDGCRVFTDWSDRPDSWKAGGHAAAPKGLKYLDRIGGIGVTCHASGRWPTNLVLVHGPGCRRAGTRKVTSSSDGTGNYQRGESADRQFNQCGATAVTNYKGVDGKETVASWECEPSCPVALLDGQSGPSKASGGPIKQNGSSWKCSNQTGTYERICDEGGASRFYPQFASFAECLAWLGRLVGEAAFLG